MTWDADRSWLGTEYRFNMITPGDVTMLDVRNLSMTSLI